MRLSLILFFCNCFLFSSGQVKQEMILELDSMERFMSLPLHQPEPAMNQRKIHNLRYVNQLSKPVTSRKFESGIPFQTDGRQICYDSSSRFTLFRDSLTYYTNNPFRTAGGQIVMSSQYVEDLGNFSYKSGGTLFRFSGNGSLLWLKKFDSLNPVRRHQIGLYKVMELHDGNLLLFGKWTNLANNNAELLIIKTNSQGDVLWNKIYRSRFWTNGNGSMDFFYVQDAMEDAVSGDIFFTGPFWSQGVGLIRIKGNNGNIVWSKSYDTGGQSERPFGLTFHNGNVLLFLRALMSGNDAFIAACQINPSSGDTIQNNYYKTNDPVGYRYDIISPNAITVTGNGHYLLSGKCVGDSYFPTNPTNQFQHAAVMEFDQNLQFIRAFSFNNQIESNGSNTIINVYPDGSGYFSMLQFFGPYSGNLFITQFQGNQITRQRVLNLTNTGIPQETLPLQTPNGGHISIKLIGDSIAANSKIQVAKIHPQDASTPCTGVSDFSTVVSPFTYLPSTNYFISVADSSFTETLVNKTLSVVSDNMVSLPGCNQTSFCDTLHLRASSNLICPGQTLTVVTRKNPECGSQINWNTSQLPISQFNQVNDSTFTFQFTSAWTGYVKGTIQGCEQLTDSVYIQVLFPPSSISLGQDLGICPGQSITLNAGTGFQSYTWQDLTTDSILTISSPGLYFVQVNDGCGHQLSDTIVVSASPPLSFSLGNDRSACNRDSIQLHAPTGMSFYQWSPNYQISAINQASVVVRPESDTTYIVEITDSNGCRGSDSIRIFVYSSPVIDLGNDRSICAGQSIILQAPTGFTTFHWSTGEQTQAIQVNQQGSYILEAITTQNCRSRDTFNIIQVYPVPVVELGAPSDLCQGSVKILDAGAYISYLWQDGSLNQTFSADTSGIYYVTVMDSNGCEGKDTTQIESVWPLPTNFLPNSSEICQYGTVRVESNKSFQEYLWNTNARQRYIDIQTPGTYWLQVTDEHQCIGTDSVTVIQKQCLSGLYVPRAFTPEPNGINDVFKALLFGRVQAFSLTIYNRYGQELFHSNNPATGWNGYYKGVPQEMGTYIWICTYQINGQPLKTEKGHFVLIR